jgi:hypothetical protein
VFKLYSYMWFFLFLAFPRFLFVIFSVLIFLSGSSKLLSHEHELCLPLSILFVKVCISVANVCLIPSILILSDQWIQNNCYNLNFIMLSAPFQAG